jgi:predicted nuclease of predicted toxin-antitoxin system
MKILFDQGTPAPLRRELPTHQISTAYEMGWSQLTNGDLLAAAEQQSFDLMITTDKNLGYQQNLRGRNLAIIVLPTTSWPTIKQNVAHVIAAVKNISTGGFAALQFEKMDE